MLTDTIKWYHLSNGCVRLPIFERLKCALLKRTRMTAFEDRQRDFEKRFQHDEELRFKTNARRNKMLGLWAAEKLGLTDAEAEAYAKEVVMSDFEEPGDDDVLRKVLSDFEAKGITIGAAKLRHEMERLMPLAKKEIMDT